VEFVEAGPAALRFQLQVWSVERVKTAGTFKSDLNFEVWRQLAQCRHCHPGACGLSHARAPHGTHRVDDALKAKGDSGRLLVYVLAP
jgi:hypothetical protein